MKKTINGLAFFPDGQRVVTGSEDRTVRVWDLENGKQVGESMEHEDGILALAVTWEGLKIVSSDKSGNVKIWDAESHELVCDVLKCTETAYPTVHAIAVSPDDEWVAIGDKSLVCVYEESDVFETPIVRVPIDSRIWSLSFSPAGNQLAHGSYDDIHVSEIQPDTDKIKQTGPLQGHTDRVRCVLWSRDGSRLFSGSHDRTIRCWDVETGEQIGQPWTGHTHFVRSLSFTPDRSIIASASWDRTVRFWDECSGDPLGHRLQHPRELNAVCISPCGEIVVSGGRDGNIYLWRVPWLNSVKTRRKMDRIKEKLVEMLRDIASISPNSHLPWSTLDVELEKKGYMIVNWPDGVTRERGTGLYSLNHGETNKLYRALFLADEDRRLRFVGLHEDNWIASLTTASESNGLLEDDCMQTTTKEMTSEGDSKPPRKRKRTSAD